MWPVDLGLSPTELAILACIGFAAGLVRGFSGFALSALVMASAVLILPPVQLIPICWCLEICASALMVRGGLADADRRIVTGLVIGGTLGTPIGLWLTTSIPIETSKLVALALILILGGLQLAKVRLAFLATIPALYVTGLVSGVATGLASVGGMVVALYVLSQNVEARRMRGSLVAYLLFTSAVSLVFQLYYDVMTTQAALRGAALALPTIIGVILGMRLFIPRFEPYYRPFCLVLLCGLAMFSLARTLLQM